MCKNKSLIDIFPQWTRMENGESFPFVYMFHAPKREVHAHNLSFITGVAGAAAADAAAPQQQHKKKLFLFYAG